MKKEIVLQFSGGIDSLYAAHLLAETYDRIHLLTFKKGRLHFALNAAASNIALLKRIHGEDKYVHTIVDITSLFKAMGAPGYRKNRRIYGNEISWCIPCRASMALMSVIYAIENEIPAFTDGANREQVPDGEKILTTADNYPEYLEKIQDMAREFGVTYTSVLYDLNTRDDRRKELVELGAKIDFNSMDRKKKSIWDVFSRDFYQRSQPICLSGYLIHWKRNFFGVKETTTSEKTLAFIGPKLENEGTNLILRYFEDKGIDIRLKRV